MQLARSLAVFGVLAAICVFPLPASGQRPTNLPTDDRTYTNPIYEWSISYPGDWTLDGQDASFVKINNPQTIPSG